MSKQNKIELINLYYHSKVVPKSPKIRFLVYLDAQGLGKSKSKKIGYLGNDAIPYSYGTFEAGVFLRDTLTLTKKFLQKDSQLGFKLRGIKEPEYANIRDSFNEIANVQVEDISNFLGATYESRKKLIFSLHKEFTTSEKVAEKNPFALKPDCQKILLAISKDLKSKNKEANLTFEVREYSLFLLVKNSKLESNLDANLKMVTKLKQDIQTAITNIKNREHVKFLDVPCYFLFDYFFDSSEHRINTPASILTCNLKNIPHESKTNLTLCQLREGSLNVFSLCKRLPISGIAKVFPVEKFKATYLNTQEKDFLSIFKVEKAEKIKEAIVAILCDYAKWVRDEQARNLT